MFCENFLISLSFRAQVIMSLTIISGRYYVEGRKALEMEA